ncbi:MAG: hypothetical protein KatS3mg076_0137 [Candidatus Binatia bacterium]|nr:MAG: hypothetical protein KatS3mg076_0137 [Candidatus Binatia bacterium]
MGDGNPTIFCDFPDLSVAGGIKGIPTPSYGPEQEVTNVLRDHACRFDVKFSSGDACTKKPLNGDPGFLGPGTIRQYCHQIPAAAAFPPGDTILTVRVTDDQGTPGPTVQIKVRAPTATPTP